MIDKNASLDDTIKHINEIYEQSNSERDFRDIIVLFFEDIGRCFQLIMRKRQDEVEGMLPSMFKWFCALYARFEGRASLASEILWKKFPGICPYCVKNRCECGVGKEVLNVKKIFEIADTQKNSKPKTLNEWQDHFQKIYPRGAESSFEINVSHLAEELAELSEAYRKAYVRKDIPCVDMELADVFSWIMGLSNLINQLKQSNRDRKEYHIGDVIYENYKEGCPKCALLRSKTKLEKCCCSVSAKKLRLISDYDESEAASIEISNSIGLQP